MNCVKLFHDIILKVLTAVSLPLFLRDDLNLQVLHDFVELHEFTDLNLVQALRYASLVELTLSTH